MLASYTRVIREQLANALWATLEQHTSDLRIRYAFVFEWLASNRRLADKMLQWRMWSE